MEAEFVLDQFYIIQSTLSSTLKFLLQAALFIDPRHIQISQYAMGKADVKNKRVFIDFETKWKFGVANNFFLNENRYLMICSFE